MRIEKQRPKIIAIDFDETIIENGFPDIKNATLKKDARKYINKLYDEGHYIIIWTCRYLQKSLTDAKNFLKDNDIHYDAINENYPKLDFKPNPKIFYDFLADDKCLLEVDWRWIYFKINVQFAQSNLYKITPQMKEWYYTRTKNHINSVNHYFDKYCRKTGLFADVLNHDFSKLEEPELSTYIAIVWNYYCKENDIEFKISNKLKEEMNNVTNIHVKNNSHHPEYWLKNKWKTNVVLLGDRDKFDPNAVPVIDISKTMTERAIIEMCSDWCSTAKERGSTPFEWFDLVKDKRWHFGKEKDELILKTLEIMWN